MCVCKFVFVLLTEAAELSYDVGQRDVRHTLQLILDVSWQHRVAQVPGLDGALYQRHPSAATPLPTVGETGRGEGGGIKEQKTKLHQCNNSSYRPEILLLTSALYTVADTCRLIKILVSLSFAGRTPELSQRNIMLKTLA